MYALESHTMEPKCVGHSRKASAHALFLPQDHEWPTSVKGEVKLNHVSLCCWLKKDVDVSLWVACISLP